MTDQLTKALAFNDEARIYILTATNLVAEAQQRHDTWHTATAAFGRTLIGSLLLAGNLKGNDRLSVIIEGSGPIGRIVTDASSQGDIRGFVSQPHVALELNESGKLDVRGAVGLPGTLKVTKHLEGGEPFSGQVALVSGELGEDFTYYMAASEQTPSAIGLSVLVNPDETVRAAGGFMIQLLPDASEETIVALEEQLQDLGRFSDLIDQGLDAEGLLANLIGEHDYRILSQTPVRYYCPCSHDYYYKQLHRLSKEDLTLLIEEDHGAEVVCHYCQEKYFYDEAELSQIVKEKA